jgi:dienelactone hydrolase
MLSLFPDDREASTEVRIGFRSGLGFGEVARVLRDFPESGLAPRDAWITSWTSHARQLELLAGQDEAAGYRGSAGERLLRASVAWFLVRSLDPEGEGRLASLEEHWRTFADGARLAEPAYEAMTLSDPAGELHGWWLPAGPGPAPALVFYAGTGLDKEMVALYLRDRLARRGVGLLVIDGPGVGEALWRDAIASRPDYETVTASAVAWLRDRPEVGDRPVGVGGLSLGGLYALRSAARDPGVACAVCWGGILDFPRLVRTRWANRTRESEPLVAAQLAALVGAADIDGALARSREWRVDALLPALTQPTLMLYGEADRQTSAEDATEAFKAVGAVDKTLRLFTAEEGGAAHCQSDDPFAARELMADWVASRLGARA